VYQFPSGKVLPKVALKAKKFLNTIGFISYDFINYYLTN
jgi:hypothetical protein